jgi:dipeptide/tripeptide permease
MGVLFKILGGIGLILVLAVFPNVRTEGSSKADVLLMGLSFLILGVGMLLDRVDRLLAALKPGESKPPA